MKYPERRFAVLLYESPSVWREWIEIHIVIHDEAMFRSLPPCGGSGLKSLMLLPMNPSSDVSLRVEGVD